MHPGRTITSFVAGTRRLYDFVDDNPLVEFHPCDRTNDVAIIRKNDRVTAINSAIEIDLTGQICADSIGHDDLFGHRRPDGFHARRGALARRQTDHRAAGHCRARHGVAHRARLAAGSRCRDDARPRAIGS